MTLSEMNGAGEGNRLLQIGKSLQKDKKLRPTNTTLKTEPATTTPSETPIPMLFQKKFKKLPQWSFEDIYNLDAPPRPMVSKLSKKNKKT